MQTFLPYQNFTHSAKCLDRQRLNKQRIEAWQILQAITNKDYGWQNHPAVKMWQSHPRLLCLYGLEICNEWRFARGYKDSLGDKFFEELCKYDDLWANGKYLEELPIWWNNEDFYSSHRAALLYKKYEHYVQFGWKEEPKYDYVWPVQ
jgi:hypothetical protein